MSQTIPIACSLKENDLRDRTNDIATLGKSLVNLQAEGRQAKLGFPSSQRSQLERFVEAESRCCPFFEFELSDRHAITLLQVGVPEDGEWALRGLVAAFVAGW